MGRLFSAGEALPLYGRVSALQAELAERDRGAAGEVRWGAQQPHRGSCFARQLPVTALRRHRRAHADNPCQL